MTEKPQPGRGRPPLPVAEQRQRLLDATMRTLRSGGLARASVQEIVREAGMSSRSFYECFGSKENLIGELVRIYSELFLARVEVAFDSSTTPTEVIGQLLNAYLDLLPVVAIDRELLSRSAVRRIQELRASYFDRLIDRVLVRIGARVAEGVIPRVPSRIAVELVLSGIEVMTVRYRREGRLAELGENRSEFVRILLSLVY